MKELTVLSLFDGMSCGQIALKELGVKVKYFAAEIDKHAIAVTQHNFPETTQLGDVTKVFAKDLPKIDIILAGSPCQGFSFAGKQLAFDDPRSKLFFEFVRILNECREINPNILFLLENVKMKKEHENVISTTLGIEPIEINSALVSAQNRKRLYWTNIKNEPYGLFGEMACTIPQPKDKGILLKDILETEVDSKYCLSDKAIEYLNRTEINQRFIQNETDNKGACVTANYHKGVPYNAVCIASTENPSVQKDNLVMQINPSNNIFIPEATKKGFIEVKPGECFDAEQLSSKTRRGRKMESKSNSLISQQMSFMQLMSTGKIRRLTPTECQRLQTVPSWYDMTITSDTQKYRMLGNGWTIEVIKHILRFM